MSSSRAPGRCRRRSLRHLWAAAALLVSLGLGTPRPAVGWSADGHRKVSLLAARLAVATTHGIPEFFRHERARIADASVEPDVRRLRDTPQLRDREYPEHYIDLELLEGAGLPGSRYEYLDLLAAKKLSARVVGTLPYALVEAVQHLAIAFAEHRARPEDPFIQARVLYLAGVLAHYSGDLSQPLHTTIHHNGRARADMTSPATGIHHLVDSLFDRVAAELSPTAKTPWPVVFEDPWNGILGALEASHELVDRVYALEDQLDWEQDRENPSPAVTEFTNERLTQAALFTARLFATAWELSSSLVLPEWRFDEAQANSGQSTPE